MSVFSNKCVAASQERLVLPKYNVLKSRSQWTFSATGYVSKVVFTKSHSPSWTQSINCRAGYQSAPRGLAWCVMRHIPSHHVTPNLAWGRSTEACKASSPAIQDCQTVNPTYTNKLNAKERKNEMHSQSLAHWYREREKEKGGERAREREREREREWML